MRSQVQELTAVITQSNMLLGTRGLCLARSGMAYPTASPEQKAFFAEHGYLVVEDAIPQKDLDELEHYCDLVLEKKDQIAYDWAWDKNEDKEKRSFRIVQSAPARGGAGAGGAAGRRGRGRGGAGRAGRN